MAARFTALDFSTEDDLSGLRHFAFASIAETDPGIGNLLLCAAAFSHLFGGSCRSPGNRRGSVSGLSFERVGSLLDPVGNGLDQQQQENSTTGSETLENAPPCGLSCRGSDSAPYASQGKE